jgi:nicotinamidase-related amidase
MSRTAKNLKGRDSNGGNAAALVLIDVINDLEFEGGDKLADNLFPIIDNVGELRRRAKQLRIPVVYVNDNFGKWQSDFRKLLNHCLNDDVRGKLLAQKLKPDADDYFVLKPRHSGFYSTTLDLLLSYLGSRRLILAGATGDLCVLFTAGDAHIRGFRLNVPSDCVASEDQQFNRYALRLIEHRLNADIRPSTQLNLEQLLSEEVRI